MKKVFLLLSLIFAAGCSSRSSASTPQQSGYVINGVDISNSSQDPALKGLPPAPDKALNDSTVAGIDSDGDGVRDDVQRYIAVKYASSAKKRAGATQAAKNYQDAFTHPPQTTQEAVATDKEAMRALDCISGFVEKGGKHTLYMEIISLMCNTPARVQADMRISDLLGGSVIEASQLDDPGVCDQDVQTMPN